MTLLLDARSEDTDHALVPLRIEERDGRTVGICNRFEMDKRLLEAMIYKFNGGPVGLSSLAVAVREDASTLEDVHEPFLIMQGYISRTPRGRVAMPSTYLKMGTAPPANGQGWLL